MADQLPAKIVRADGPHLPAPMGVSDLIGLFLESKGENTRRAYRSDCRDFAAFLGFDDIEAAFGRFITAEHGHANELALRWRLDLEARGNRSATVARKLAAIKSVVEYARFLGRVSWLLEVPTPKVEKYRSTEGPGYEGFRSMVEAARSDPSPKGRRDHALLRLLHDVALRRAEAISLDLADLDLDGGSIRVVGKGRRDPTRITIPPPVVRAIRDWLEVRGPEAGPLFIRMDRGARGLQRLTGRGVHQVVGGLGERAALPSAVRPHGLRHGGITRALDLSKGDVRRVRKFSRHIKIETLLVYDDNRADVAGEIARQVSED